MTTIENPTAVPGVRPRPDGNLFAPAVDFLALGGVSLLLLPLLLLLPDDALEREIGIVALVVANFVNHPHFAASYALFYENFRSKVSGRGGENASMRLRYRFAGVLVPVALLAGSVAAIVDDSGQLMGYALSAMAFFVGWHYVKQGYGMAMVDAALKRAFFGEASKRILRLNGYLVWLVSWTTGTRSFDDEELFFGFPMQPVGIPDSVVAVLVASMIGSSLATGAMLLHRLQSGRPTAWTGIVAYVVSLYLWLLLARIEPLFLLLVPALHSLQYLVVVARFEGNRAEADPARPSVRSTLLRAIGLGFALFWVIPIVLEGLNIARGAGDDGRLSFVAAAWILINIHHYFIDNVIWRRDNALVRRHLFRTAA